MSVRTTADEKLENVRDHVKGAVDELSEIVIGKCWGHDDFNKEYKQKIKDAFLVLLEM